MKLYYFETANGRKPCVVAKYLGLPVEYIHVDLSKGAHKSPIAINPRAAGWRCADHRRLWRCRIPANRWASRIAAGRYG